MAAYSPGSTREAVLVFHYADRMKSELLIASQLLPAVQGLSASDRTGGLRVLLEYFRALDREVALGQALISDPEMIRVKTVMTGLLGMVDAGMLGELQGHLTWIISTMTTYAQRAMEYLIKAEVL
ncbi:MAG: hypothetical protein FJ128_03975 [Deltaproteobacteria bacterium]|nr:hypothetical protein [Deltaproteobacteria bacterium]